MSDNQNQPYKFLKEATLEQLVNQVIWESVMSYTAWTGMTQKYRLGLVEEVQSSVQWAIAQKKDLNERKSD